MTRNNYFLSGKELEVTVASKGDIARRREIRKLEAKRDELIERKARTSTELMNVKAALRNRRKVA